MSMRRRSWLVVGVAGMVVLGLAGGCTEGCGSGAEGEPAGAAAPTTVYLVRHAEKDAGEDPDLTERGKLRALALPTAIEVSALAAIYSTATKRTEQTAAVVAAVTGLPITRMPPTDYAGLLERVGSHAGAAVLVVGHSNTVPEILTALGVPGRLSLDEDDYGDLFVVTVPARGPASVESRRFGD